MALPPPKLDKRTTDKLNLQVLQRVDPEVEEVLVTAGHVALYHLDVPNMQWGRKDVEGSLFVVKRRTQPRFQFIVLNQRSTANLVQDILGEFQCELSKPYLFYRNNGVVNGIWFFSEQECEEVASLIQRIQGMFNTLPSQENRSIITTPMPQPTRGGGPPTLECAPAQFLPPPEHVPLQAPLVNLGTPLDINMLLGQAQSSVAEAQGANAATSSGTVAADPAVSAAGMVTSAPPYLLSPNFFKPPGVVEPIIPFLSPTASDPAGHMPPMPAPVIEPPTSISIERALQAMAAPSSGAGESVTAGQVTPADVPASNAPLHVRAAMMTAVQLEQQMTQGASMAEMEPAQEQGAQMSRDMVREALMSLVQQDTFVDMITAALQRVSVSSPSKE